MRSDIDIYNEVIERLAFEPEVNSADIVVSVHLGIVSLGGEVTTYSEKVAAEHAVKNIDGVKGIANEIKVVPTTLQQRTDREIAEAAVKILSSNVNVPFENIKVIVEDSWVFLNGEVQWYFQKKEAELAVRSIFGVRGLTNEIVIKPSMVIKGEEVKEKIMEQFGKQASFEAQSIQVEVKGNKVILRGKVSSYREMVMAVETAWLIPGVGEVDNHLVIV
ncbi:MAG: Osmotically-inducible protein precursor [Francisellaceae bacterium]|nr:Osmotically-inducible protein precursor [Francisellaceae bacterium]